MIPWEVHVYLDRGAVIELEESRWVIVDVNHADSDICVTVQGGLPAVCGSEPQGIARSLQEEGSGELAVRPPHSAPAHSNVFRKIRRRQSPGPTPTVRPQHV